VWYLLYIGAYLLIALIPIVISVGAARQDRKDAKSDRNLPILTAPTPDSFATIDFEVRYRKGIVIALLVPGILFLLIGVLLVAWFSDGLFADGALVATVLVLAAVGGICTGLAYGCRRLSKEPPCSSLHTSHAHGRYNPQKSGNSPTFHQT